jgi:hypothetical protein
MTSADRAATTAIQLIVFNEDAPLLSMLAALTSRAGGPGFSVSAATVVVETDASVATVVDTSSSMVTSPDVVVDSVASVLDDSASTVALVEEPVGPVLDDSTSTVALVVELVASVVDTPSVAGVVDVSSNCVVVAGGNEPKNVITSESA